jgi:hypothetical protein
MGFIQDLAGIKGSQKISLMSLIGWAMIKKIKFLWFVVRHPKKYKRIKKSTNYIY